jgi:histone deacetylase 6
LISVPYPPCFLATEDDGPGDQEYLAAFHAIVLPLLREYQPGLVLVSAGFDAAAGDPLGGCCVTPQGFGEMTRLLVDSMQRKNVILLMQLLMRSRRIA